MRWQVHLPDGDGTQNRSCSRVWFRGIAGLGLVVAVDSAAVDDGSEDDRAGKIREVDHDPVVQHFRGEDAVASDPVVQHFRGEDAVGEDGNDDEAVAREELSTSHDDHHEACGEASPVGFHENEAVHAICEVHGNWGGRAMIDEQARIGELEVRGARATLLREEQRRTATRSIDGVEVDTHTHTHWFTHTHTHTGSHWCFCFETHTLMSVRIIAGLRACVPERRV